MRAPEPARRPQETLTRRRREESFHNASLVILTPLMHLSNATNTA
jgi:hypothetical protein